MKVKMSEKEIGREDRVSSKVQESLNAELWLKGRRLTLMHDDSDNK